MNTQRTALLHGNNDPMCRLLLLRIGAFLLLPAVLVATPDGPDNGSYCKRELAELIRRTNHALAHTDWAQVGQEKRGVPYMSREDWASDRTQRQPLGLEAAGTELRLNGVDIENGMANLLGVVLEEMGSKGNTEAATTSELVDEIADPQARVKLRASLARLQEFSNGTSDVARVEKLKRLRGWLDAIDDKMATRFVATMNHSMENTHLTLTTPASFRGSLWGLYEVHGKIRGKELPEHTAILMFSAPDMESPQSLQIYCDKLQTLARAGLGPELRGVFNVDRLGAPAILIENPVNSIFFDTSRAEVKVRAGDADLIPMNKLPIIRNDIKEMERKLEQMGEYAPFSLFVTSTGEPLYFPRFERHSGSSPSQSDDDFLTNLSTKIRRRGFQRSFREIRNAFRQ